MRQPEVVQTWGSSAAERAATYPCDDLIHQPDGAVFRAVDIGAPSDLVFRWLCQLRVAPYSYDWIDNLGRRSPRDLIDGLSQLKIGQRFMVIFRLVAFETGHSITLDSDTAMFGRVAVTYLVVPKRPNQSRLIVKLTYAAPRGAYGRLLKAFVPTGDLIMMRKQLLTLKRLIERDAERELASAGH